MANDCSEVSKENARIGDSYYRSFTKWVTGRGRSGEQREKTSILARMYHRSLQLLLDCLRRLRRSPAVERKIETAVEFQSLLEKDIEFLTRDQGTPERAMSSENIS